MEPKVIIQSIERITRTWAKQRKAEERNASAAWNRQRALVRSVKVTLKEGVYDCMQASYLAVSSDGTLPAHARQLMYEVRRRLQGVTEEPLDDKYFTQTLLPAYMRENAAETAQWDVVFDARGHLHEPHTAIEVALGTLDVRRYMSGTAESREASYQPDELFPTHGPVHRYSAVLFIEKEGFLPLFQKVKLSERFDIAIMSTKGLSNTASRKLVDHVCGGHDLPLLVLHDFDKSGFSIASTLSSSSDRYSFKHEIRSIDLGLRLVDVETWKLDSEGFSLTSSARSIRANLRKNGATEEEAEFISDGRRVELNAFTSADLVKFIETKLKAFGVKKLIPDAATQEEAYRRALRNRFIRGRFDELKEEADRYASEATVPDLNSQIKNLLKGDPAMPWDIAVQQVARKAMKAPS